MKTILFVCSGNTCRSPLALAAWRTLEKSGVTPLETRASSAGIATFNGRAAAQHTIALARSWGEDLSQHRSQVLLHATAQSAARIAVMDRSHGSVLQEYFHVPKNRIVLLAAFDLQSSSDEIPDPFGKSFKAYKTCAQQLYRAVEGLVQAMKRKEL